MKKSNKFKLKKIALAVGFLSSSCLAASASAAVTYYDADSSNSTISSMDLLQSSLGNSILSNPSQLAPGSNVFKYAAVVFTPTEDGVYTFGQTSSPIDTVMILYDNIFDPTAPGANALVGNDDTSQSVHQATIGSPVAVQCGSSNNYCPQITYSVTAGVTYTLLVPVYSPSYNSNFEFPFRFYSNGSVVFGQYTGRTPINTAKPYYLASELGITVDPMFVGGTLRMDQVNGIYTGDFTLSNMATNTIDQYGNHSVFRGVFSDAVSGNGGHITIDNTGTGGWVIFEGDNTYSGSTTIKDGGILSVSKDANLGDATASLIVDGGTLLTTETFSSNRDVTLASTGAVHVTGNKTLTLTGSMTGTGSWVKEGAGTLVLTSNNTYTGSTTVAGGILIVGDADSSLTGGSSLSGGNSISVANGAAFGGYGSVTGNVDNNGIIAIGSAISASTSGALANFVINGDLTNSNTILLGGNTAGDTLTINGNYIGNQGSVILNAILESDLTVTDKLVINGDASGTTYLSVNNLGGAGAQVIEGIEVVYVSGNSASDAFVQNGRIVAGAYEYELMQGNASGTNTQSWFLSSRSIMRPEVGGYVGLIESNQGAFNHSFHDRQQLLDNEYQSSWARLEYTRSKSKVGEGNQLTNKTDRMLVHIGSDFYQKDALHLGVMAGYSKGDIDTETSMNTYKTKSKSDGYSLGLYGTLFNQGKNEDGLYVDSYVQYNWFDNEVEGSQLGTEKFDTHGVTVSAEAGYGFVLGNTSETRWLLEPQAQIIYNNYSGGDHTEKNGTRIRTNESDNFSGRVGLRLQGKNDSVQPFVTLNYWHHSNQASVSMDGDKVDSNRARNLFEVKMGGQVKLSNNVHLYGQIQDSFGKDSTHNYGGNIGVKVTW